MTSTVLAPHESRSSNRSSLEKPQPQKTARSGPTVIDEERQFLIEELFFSTTNQRGVIRHGNEVFARIAGIAPEDLYGAPHSVIRHPDMPRVVFQLLWQTIERGQTIAAYVKNLASDGRYYWVLAVVVPCDNGYLSVRLKPTSEMFGKVVELYNQLRQIEAKIEVEPKQRQAAMAASAQELDRQLNQLGFANYEAFMFEALSAELTNRRKHLQEAAGNHFNKLCIELSDGSANRGLYDSYRNCAAIDEQLQTVFDRLDEFKSISVSLGSKSRRVLDSAHTIRMLAMNSAVAANKLGTRADTLRVVSESLGTISKDSSAVISEMSSGLDFVVKLLNQLIFDVAATKLQSEISLVSLNEILVGKTCFEDERTRESMTILVDQLAIRVKSLFAHMRKTRTEMMQLSRLIDNLDRNNRALRFVQFAGKKEATGWSEAKDFSVVLEDVPPQIATTKTQCEELDQAIKAVLGQIESLQSTQTELAERVDALKSWNHH